MFEKILFPLRLSCSVLEMESDELETSLVSVALLFCNELSKLSSIHTTELSSPESISRGDKYCIWIFLAVSWAKTNSLSYTFSLTLSFAIIMGVSAIKLVFILGTGGVAGLLWHFLCVVLVFCGCSLLFCSQEDEFSFPALLSTNSGFFFVSPHLEFGKFVHVFIGWLLEWNT